MNAIASIPKAVGVEAAEARHCRKISDAARDFEAVLLNMLIKSLEEGFSALPGGDHPVGFDSYRDFEGQALASSLAAHGGLGIARMIAGNLEKANGLGCGAVPKVPAATADEGE